MRRWDSFALGLPELGVRVRDAYGREGVVVEQARHAYSWALDATTDDPACGWRVSVQLDTGGVLVYRPWELTIVE